MATFSLLVFGKGGTSPGEVVSAGVGELVSSLLHAGSMLIKDNSITAAIKNMRILFTYLNLLFVMAYLTAGCCVEGEGNGKEGIRKAPKPFERPCIVLVVPLLSPFQTWEASPFPAIPYRLPAVDLSLGTVDRRTY